MEAVHEGEENKCTLHIVVSLVSFFLRVTRRGYGKRLCRTSGMSLDTNGRKCSRGVQLRRTRIPLHPTSTPADALSGCGFQSSSIIDTHGCSPRPPVTSPTRHLDEARNPTFSANAGLLTLQGFAPSCSGLELNP